MINDCPASVCLLLGILFPTDNTHASLLARTSKWSITVESSSLDQSCAAKHAGRLCTFWLPWLNVKTWLVAVDKDPKHSLNLFFSWSGKAAAST